MKKKDYRRVMVGSATEGPHKGRHREIGAVVMGRRGAMAVRILRQGCGDVGCSATMDYDPPNESMSRYLERISAKGRKVKGR